MSSFAHIAEISLSNLVEMKRVFPAVKSTGALRREGIRTIVFSRNEKQPTVQI